MDHRVGIQPRLMQDVILLVGEGAERDRNVLLALPGLREPDGQQQIVIGNLVEDMEGQAGR